MGSLKKVLFSRKRNIYICHKVSKRQGLLLVLIKKLVPRPFWLSQFLKGKTFEVHIKSSLVKRPSFCVNRFNNEGLYY